MNKYNHIYLERKLLVKYDNDLKFIAHKRFFNHEKKINKFDIPLLINNKNTLYLGYKDGYDLYQLIDKSYPPRYNLGEVYIIKKSKNLFYLFLNDILLLS
jgi:hypothetical protein